MKGAYEQEVDSVENGRVRWKQAEIRSRRKSHKKTSVNIAVARAKRRVAMLLAHSAAIQHVFWLLKLST